MRQKHVLNNIIKKQFFKTTIKIFLQRNSTNSKYSKVSSIIIIKENKLVA